MFIYLVPTLHWDINSQPSSKLAPNLDKVSKQLTFLALRYCHLHASRMGVTIKILKPGNGTDNPKPGDEVTIEYTGNLYDEKHADNDYRGEQ